MDISSRLVDYDWCTTPATFRSYDTLYPLVKDFSGIIANKEVLISHPYLFIYYPVRSYEGGNCWNDNTPTYRIYDNKSPQLHDLFLELTGFQLQELNVETHIFTHYQHYGNSTDYKALVIDLDKAKTLYEKYNLEWKLS